VVYLQQGATFISSHLRLFERFKKKKNKIRERKKIIKRKSKEGK